MIARILGLLLMVVTVISLHAPSAHARAEPSAAVNSFFAALNAGDKEAAVASFAQDAVATLVRGETYRGAEEIGQLVELMEHPGRYHRIVQADTVGNIVTVVVDIYDRGIRWGEDRIVIEVEGGKLHTYHEQSLHVRFG